MGNPSPPGEGRGEGNGTCRGPVSVVFCPASASLQRPAQEELHPLPFPSPSGRGEASDLVVLGSRPVI
jgi:hypothetical protein